MLFFYISRHTKFVALTHPSITWFLSPLETEENMQTLVGGEVLRADLAWSPQQPVDEPKRWCCCNAGIVWPMTSILIIAHVKRTSSSSSSSSSSGTVLTKLSRSKWTLASLVNSEWMAASLLGDNCSATTSVSSKRLLRWESRLWFWGGRAWGEFKLRKVY